MEMQLCQRYYQSYAGQSLGQASSAQTLYTFGIMYFANKMRIAPTIGSGSSYTVSTGLAGSPLYWQPASTTSASFYNASNNWTTGANVTLSINYNAEL